MERNSVITFEIRYPVPEVTHTSFMDVVRNLGVESMGGYAEKMPDGLSERYKGNLIKFGKGYFTVIADDETKKVVFEPVEWKETFMKLTDLPIEVTGRNGDKFYFAKEEEAVKWLSNLKMVDQLNFIVKAPGYYGTALMYIESNLAQN